MGDSLLLTPGADRTNVESVITITDESGAVYAEYRQPIAGYRTPVPVLFNRAGPFQAVATVDGISAGALDITVIQVDLQAPIACQIGYRREKEVLVYGPTNGLAFTANDGALLQASVKQPTARGLRLYLKPLKSGSPVVQARLGGAAGAILAQQEIDEFTLRSLSTTTIGVIENFPDGAKLVETYLEMDPRVPDLTVKLHIIIRGVTFEDSTLDKELSTNAFTYDPASGKWLWAWLSFWPVLGRLWKRGNP